MLARCEFLNLIIATNLLLVPVIFLSAADISKGPPVEPPPTWAEIIKQVASDFVLAPEDV